MRWCALFFSACPWGQEALSPGGSPLRVGRHVSPGPGEELPSAPDTMLQTLGEYPGRRPVLSLCNSECCNLATSV